MAQPYRKIAEVEDVPGQRPEDLMREGVDRRPGRVVEVECPHEDVLDPAGLIFRRIARVGGPRLTCLA